MKKTLGNYAKRMGLSKPGTEGIIFRNAAEPPFELTGFPWFGKDRLFRRLPAGLEGKIPSAVDCLADNTSGGKIRFRSDSGRVLIRAKRSEFLLSDNMDYLGISGFDLYAGEPGKEVFRGVTRTNPKDREFLAEPFGDRSGTMRSFLINFPLYTGVERVEIGLDAGARLEEPLPLNDPDRFIAVYGTSITQGGCASHPGNCYVNILSRRLGRHFCNFGFSGAGQGEPAVAQILAGLQNVSLYLLDFEPNAGAMFQPRLAPFIRELRKKHPSTPILVLSRYAYASGPVPPDDPVKIRAILDSLHDPEVHYFDGSRILGDDWRDCLVDGVHASDRAFFRMADALEPAIRRILG